MATKIDEQGVYPTLLADLGGKNDHGSSDTNANTQTQQNGARANARGKDDPMGSYSSSGGGVKMEGEGLPPTNNNMSSKMDTFHPSSFPNSFQASPFVNTSSFQPSAGFASGVFHNSNDLFDPSKGLSMNSRSSLDGSMLNTPRTSIDVASLMGTPRNSLDAASLLTPRTSIDNVGQSRILDPSKLTSVSQGEPAKLINPTQPSTTTLTSSTATPASTSTAGGAQANPANFTYDERFHLIYEREIRWTEVRRYAEFIRRFATELSHMDITKENFYDLYNMALCLLKSVDGLDPDKLNRKQTEVPGQSGLSSANLVGATTMQGQPVSDMDMQRKNFEFIMNNRGNSAFDASAFMSPIKYGIPTTTGDSGAVFTYNQTTPEGVVPVGTYALPLGASPSPFGAGSYMKANELKPKNFTGEVFFDDLNQGDDRRPKRRRRRTVYSSRRNLHCHMCGVTETPEWRRGPAGDHTLCNACGLHYAKSLKKQRKERDSRKHSIDMLLNESQQQNQSGENPATPSPGTTPPTNGSAATSPTVPSAQTTPAPPPVPAESI